MSQSVSLFSPGSPSHSCSLLIASGWFLQTARGAAQELLAARVGELEEVVVGGAQLGLAPDTAEYGFFRSVGA
jgi:hypothetical protein